MLLGREPAINHEMPVLVLETAGHTTLIRRRGTDDRSAVGVGLLFSLRVAR
jgi:hypothetical protein